MAKVTHLGLAGPDDPIYRGGVHVFTPIPRPAPRPQAEPEKQPEEPTPTDDQPTQTSEYRMLTALEVEALRQNKRDTARIVKAIIDV